MLGGYGLDPAEQTAIRDHLAARWTEIQQPHNRYAQQARRRTEAALTPEAEAVADEVDQAVRGTASIYNLYPSDPETDDG